MLLNPALNPTDAVRRFETKKRDVAFKLSNNSGASRFQANAGYHNTRQ